MTVHLLITIVESIKYALSLLLSYFFFQLIEHIASVFALLNDQFQKLVKIIRQLSCSYFGGISQCEELEPINSKETINKASLTEEFMFNNKNCLFIYHSNFGNK